MNVWDGRVEELLRSDDVTQRWRGGARGMLLGVLLAVLGVLGVLLAVLGVLLVVGGL